MDDFAAFRAAHPTVSAAIDACDRPDWLLRLAWEAIDHKQALFLGASDAKILTSTELEIFKPWPGPLEPVDVWLADTDEVSRTRDLFRGVIAATPLAGLVAYAGDRLYGGSLGFARWWVYSIVTLSFMFVIGLGIKTVNDRVVKRRAARLDEESALALVLAVIAKGMVKKPKLVSLVVQNTKRHVQRLVPSPPAAPAEASVADAGPARDSAQAREPVATTLAMAGVDAFVERLAGRAPAIATGAAAIAADFGVTAATPEAAHADPVAMAGADAFVAGLVERNQAFVWPEFSTSAWTATFESYDQYREDVYYRVRFADGSEVVAKLSTPAGDDWTRPEFASDLRDQISRFVESHRGANQVR